MLPREKKKIELSMCPQVNLHEKKKERKIYWWVGKDERVHKRPNNLENNYTET